MTGFSTQEAAAILKAYDFACFAKVVDVGGGQGLFIAAILNANPMLKGVLFELPQVIADRCQVLARPGRRIYG